MVNENLKAMIENKKPVEEVREIENKIPSYEEFMKTCESDGTLNYADLNGGSVGEVKGYGPCKNSLCGCYCYSVKCVCNNDSAGVGRFGLSLTASGKKWEKENNSTDINDLPLKLVGAKDRGVSGRIGGSLFKAKDHTGDARFLGGSVEGKIDKNGIVGRASASLMDFKSDGFHGRVGLAADTGFSVENGLEVKAVGFGFTVGDQVGISTPVGEIKVDKDKCVIQ